jgi:acyl transferase domain-containing protein
VDWSAGAVSLLTETTPWPETGVRRAAVSSFGVSGTNVHVILEQPEPAATTVAAGPAGPLPWALSARSEAALRAQAARLLPAVEGADPVAVARVLAGGRATFEHRAVVFGATPEEFASGLAAVRDGDPAGHVVRGTPGGGGKTAFLFTGQGAQRAGMGHELYQTYPAFAAAFDAVCAHLDPRVRQVVFDGGPELDTTEFAQQGIFAVEVALVRLLEAWGLRPDVVLGHSVGEIAAAHIAGVLSLADAAALVTARGRLMQALPPGGAMVAIEAAEAELGDLGDDVALAAVNGPAAVVVSGAEAAVMAVAAGWAARGRRTKRLTTSHAFHSPLMSPMLAGFRTALAGLTFAQPAMALVTTGGDGDPATAEYWVGQVAATVRFADGVAALRARGVGTWVEIGPDAVLSALVEDAVPVLRADRPEATTLISALARLHVRGAGASWTKLLGAATQPVELPTYPFEHERYWLQPGTPPAADPAGARFWDAVREGDTAGLAATLGVADDALGSVLPALARWRAEADADAGTGDWRYHVVWRPAGTPDRGAPAGTWLVVVPAGRAAEAWITRVAGVVDATVLELPAGAGRADVAALLPEAEPAGVLSLLTDVGQTVSLVQALGDTGCAAPLWCVTRNAVQVEPGEPVDPAQAEIWGLGRVVGLEHPRRWGGCVDLPAEAADVDAELLAGVLAAADEDQVALRPSGVHVRRLVRAPGGPKVREWRPRGTVLVTGGTGALGGHVARRLAADGAEHLILTSRRGEAAPGVADLVDELTALGARVTVRACDVADRAALAAVLAEIPPELPLTAVVHAAGAGEPESLMDTDLAEFTRVRSAKAQGAANLDALLGDTPLAAFVLFSSIAATWGSGGQAAYSAANAALDALAGRRRARGLTATSIAWGPWAGPGMAEGEAGVHMARRGVPGLPPRLAVAELVGAVERDETAVVVADVDWTRFVPAFTAMRPSPLLAELPEVREVLAELAAEAGPDGTAAEILRAADEGELDQVLLDIVRGEIAAVLGHSSPEAVDVRQPLRDVGLDSLAAVELRNGLSRATGFSLPSTLVFDYPTATALVAHLREQVEPTADPLAGELDRVAAVLATLTGDQARARVLARLEALLAQWRDPAGPSLAGRIESASDDEMFRLLDTEFGIS